MDGYGTHHNPQCIKILNDKKIIHRDLVPTTTHHCQPVDQHVGNWVQNYVQSMYFHIHNCTLCTFITCGMYMLYQL